MSQIHRGFRRWGRDPATLFVFLLMLPFHAGSAEARQAGHVEGVVVAAGSRDPVAGVQITVDGLDRSAVSDAVGRFRLPDLPPGRHVVVAERIGVQRARRTVVVRPGETTSIAIEVSIEALELGDLVVSVSREAQRRAETPASVGVLDGAAIRDARASHPSEVMNRIPGVWISTTGGEGHMTAIRQPQTTNPVYLFLEDGVPTRSTGFFNHNALYEVNLPQADRIEVLKGPATALYGSDAIGGTISVGTRPPSEEPSIEASVEAGSHGWARLLAGFGGTWGKDGFRADLNATRTDGWRDGTAYDRYAATLRWDRSLGGSAALKTVLSLSAIDQQTAGASTLGPEDYSSRPTMNYTPISFREVRAARLSSELTLRGDRSLLTVTPFARANRMDMLPNWSLTYDPTISSGGHESIGILVKYRRDFDRLRARIITGADVDYSPGDNFERIIVPVREGPIFTAYEQGDAIYDYDVTFRGISPYVQAEASPTDRLRVVAGLRLDYLGYAYRNHLDVATTGRHRRPADTDVSYTHLSPKLGATLALSRDVSIFATYGHGFRAPSEGQLFRQGSAVNTVGLEPVRADSYEGGVRARIGDRLALEVAAYSMTKKDDILQYTHLDGTRETVNAGRTLHRGIEAGLGLELAHGVRFDLSYARSRHTYEEWRPADGVDLGGNEMEQAPRETILARLAIEPEALRGGGIDVEWNRIGTYWMDPENTTKYGGHDLLNLRIRQPLHDRFVVFARVTNLGDVLYAERAAYTVARGEEYAPGLPRTLYVGIQYR